MRIESLISRKNFKSKLPDRFSFRYFDLYLSLSQTIYKIIITDITAEKECECVFFKALPPPDQIVNREFRLIAQEGRDIPGLAVSLCGSCVKQARADRVLAQKTASLLSTNLKH